jgi:hypothetical protein
LVVIVRTSVTDPPLVRLTVGDAMLHVVFAGHPLTVIGSEALL